MLENCRRPSAKTLITLFSFAIYLGFAPVLADEGASAQISAHILKAEIALQSSEYLAATIEYRKAAQLSDDAELARKATRLGFAYRFNEEAILSARRWLKLDKKSDEARAFLGQLYFRLDNIRKARRQFERLIKSGSEDPGTRLLSLLAYLADEHQPARADKLMRTLARPYPDSAKAHYAVAVLALQADDIAFAKERADRAMELDPDYLRPKLLYARALMFDGEKDKAIEYLAHIVGDSARPDPDARMELALMFMLADRDDDALSQVNQVLMEQGGRIDALRLMAIINFRLERLDAAWDDFEDLLASGQYRMDALYYMARIADYREQYDHAVHLYRDVQYGSNSIFSQRRASALMAHQLDDIEGAFKLLDAFAIASPDNAIEVVTLKAQLLISLKKYEHGLTLFEKAIEFRPDDENLFLGHAELLLRIDRTDEALAQYRLAAKKWPESAVALNALGYTLADRTDNYSEALKFIARARRIDPESPAIIDSMGWVLFKLGRHEEALIELQRAFEKLHDHEVAAHIVEVLVALGQPDEALQRLESAQESDPDSTLLKNVRERFFSAEP